MIPAEKQGGHKKKKKRMDLVQIQYKGVLTMSEYSTLMMLQSRMEGETGGIFSILPFHVSVLPDDKDSPRMLATSCLTSFIFPLA